MKKIILGIVLIAISNVIAWNGKEWSQGIETSVFLVISSFMIGGVILTIRGAQDLYD